MIDNTYIWKREHGALSCRGLLELRATAQELLLLPEQRSRIYPASDVHEVHAEGRCVLAIRTTNIYAAAGEREGRKRSWRSVMGRFCRFEAAAHRAALEKLLTLSVETD